VTWHAERNHAMQPSASKVACSNTRCSHMQPLGWSNNDGALTAVSLSLERVVSARQHYTLHVGCRYHAAAPIWCLNEKRALPTHTQVLSHVIQYYSIVLHRGILCTRTCQQQNALTGHTQVLAQNPMYISSTHTHRPIPHKPLYTLAPFPDCCKLQLLCDTKRIHARGPAACMEPALAPHRQCSGSWTAHVHEALGYTACVASAAQHILCSPSHCPAFLFG